MQELSVSTASTVRDVLAMPRSDSTDRRADRRYPIVLQLQYTLRRKTRACYVGLGRTLNISSHGILFETDERIPGTGEMELAVNWPFLLQDSCRLRLIVRGRVLRTHDKTVALKVECHEFRTAGRALQERAVGKHWGVGLSGMCARTGSSNAA